jgi:hypothetical protein
VTKFDTPSANASSAPETTAGATTGSAMSRATLNLEAPVISAASRRSPFTLARAAAMSMKEREK